MANWKSALSVVAQVAPMIAGTLAGPLGSAGVTALESALGVIKQSDNIGKRQEDVAAAVVGATPEQLLALKTADQSFQVKMKEIGFGDVESLAKLAVDDRISARSMQVATKDLTPRVLAVAVTTGFFGILLFMLLRSVPDASRDILNIMLGALGTAWTGIIAYYFGSSAGSAAKTELLAKASPVKD